MLNRLSVLWLVLGALGGYLVAGPSVTAQSEQINVPTALSSGNTVRLRFERGTYEEGPYSLTCIVAEVQAHWVRCRNADAFQDEREQRWVSLERVIQITKQEK